MSSLYRLSAFKRAAHGRLAFACATVLVHSSRLRGLHGARMSLSLVGYGSRDHQAGHNFLTHGPPALALCVTKAPICCCWLRCMLRLRRHRYGGALRARCGGERHRPLTASCVQIVVLIAALQGCACAGGACALQRRRRGVKL